MTLGAVRLGLDDIGQRGLAVAFTGPDCVQWTHAAPWTTDRTQQVGAAVHRFGGYTPVLWVRLQPTGSLGVRVLQLKSWARQMPMLSAGGLVEGLEAIGGPAVGVLKLERVTFVRRNGPRAGTVCDYERAVVTELRPDPRLPRT